MSTRTITTPDTFPSHYRPGDILPMHEVATHARQSGSHWFDPDAKRFFGSRVANFATLGADGRAYFVSSEQDRPVPGFGPGAWNGARRYTCRAYDPATGEVQHADRADRDAFGRYATHQGASAALARMAAR